MPSDSHPLTETLSFATLFIYQNMVQPTNMDTIAKKARRLFAKSKKPSTMLLLHTVKEQEVWVVRQLASEHGVDEQQVFHHLLVSTNPPPPPPNAAPATALVQHQTPLSPPRAPRSSPNAARSPDSILFADLFADPDPNSCMPTALAEPIMLPWPGGPRFV